MKKKPLVILAGPTAVGKTAASVGLAKAVGGEIVSADSMQVYKYMDIGTAKIRPQEMQGIPHYLIDVLEPDEEFHVLRFQKMAKQAMEEIYAKGKIPILVGGTGFYIQAVLYDIDFTENGDLPSFRRELEALAEERGGAFLHEMLQKVDPVSANTIHPNNIKRVIRALEYHHQTGKPFSLHNSEQRQKQPPYQYAYIVLNDERQSLYERIDLRVGKMLEDGLVGEVQALKERGYTKDMVSMQGLGYKEILDHLDGLCTLEEAAERIRQGTRHFAKRQITWFKREPDVFWLEKQDYGRSEEKILQRMIDILRERGILPPASDKGSGTVMQEIKNNGKDQMADEQQKK